MFEEMYVFVTQSVLFVRMCMKEEGEKAFPAVEK